MEWSGSFRLERYICRVECYSWCLKENALFHYTQNPRRQNRSMYIVVVVVVYFGASGERFIDDDDDDDVGDATLATAAVR